MVNVNKLKGKIVERGLNVDGLAEKVGMDKSTFYRKLANEGSTFTIGEADGRHVRDVDRGSPFASNCRDAACHGT